MCWNPEVSLTTYTFSTLSILLALNLGILKLSNFLIIQSFIIMQLIEFFLWIYLKHNKLNTFFSILGFIAILSQPFLTLFSIQHFNYKNLIIGSYIVFILYLIFTQNIEYKTVVGINKHLEWKWLNFPLHIILIWLFFLCFKYFYYFYSYSYKEYINEFYTFLFIIITFIFSYISFLNTKTWGSMWCWYANIISVFFLCKSLLSI